MLTRYWIKFETQAAYEPLIVGCGVTAYNKDDVVILIDEVLFKYFDKRQIAEIIPNIDIQTLEASHIRPNMGNPVVRGIWYPNLNSF